MDKKNVILGTLFLLGAFAAMYWTSPSQAEREAAAAAAAEAARQEAAESGEASPGTVPLLAPAELRPSGETAAPFVREALEAPDPLASTTPERTATLENDHFRATFTSRGGTLRSLAITERKSDGQLRYPTTEKSGDPVVLHVASKISPLGLAQKIGGRFRPIELPFELLEESGQRVVFATELGSGVRLKRTYAIVRGADGTPENFTLRHELEVENTSDTPFNLDALYINLGTASPTNADPYGMDLNASVYDDGSYDNIPGSKFKDGFFSGAKDEVVETGRIQWGAVKNQFFTSILTPDEPVAEMTVLGVTFPPVGRATKPPVGVTAYFRLDLPTLAAGSSQVLGMDYYSGPKDYNRLTQMALEQEDVMQFGWFLGMFLGIITIVAESLFWLLSLLHGWIGNWGFAIIFMTLIVRLLLWPLTAKAARSSKRMQELQKPMAELKEKYKDNPQKQQQATLELFKKHKINPLSSCWPVLLQFPIFIAMFNLLRNTADLRFAHFLWIGDLSMPDRSIPLGDLSLPFVGNSINILPFFWLASMWFQMKLMPQPSVDNSQTKIIKFFPFLFFPATYFFSSGLVLYWTTTNCFSIFQGWMTRRTKDAEDVAIEVEIAESEKKKSTTIKSTPLAAKKKKKRNR